LRFVVPTLRKSAKDGAPVTLLRSLIWTSPGLLLVLGCQHLAPSKPVNELTAQEAKGHQIFVSQCSSCHYANTEKGLNGPGLEGLFRKPYLPSGGAANDARVTAVIMQGRNMMPALGNTLSDQQLEDLMAYLHTL
jgi:mono/diheme cytochrome c family protein